MANMHSKRGFFSSWKFLKISRLTSLEENINWLEWAGLTETNRDELIARAKLKNVPVFKEDSDKEIYDRVRSAENLWACKVTVYINAGIAVISFAALLVSICVLLKK